MKLVKGRMLRVLVEAFGSPSKTNGQAVLSISAVPFLLDVVVLTEDGFGLGHGVNHGVMDVGERLLVFTGKLLGDIAQVGEVVVVDSRVKAGEELGIDSAWRANDDVLDADLFQAFDDEAHVLFILGTDGVIVRLVAAVIHAVAGGGDGGIKDAEVILQAGGKTAGTFTTPAKLEDFDIRPASAGEQVGLDVFGVELLLCDAVTNDGDAGFRWQEGGVFGREDGGAG